MTSKKFNVLLSKTAVKQLKLLQKKVRYAIRKTLAGLAEDPFTSRSGCDIKKLHGSKDPVFYRLRVGEYRVIYTVIQKDVKVTEILHRKKAYSFLE